MSIIKPLVILWNNIKEFAKNIYIAKFGPETFLTILKNKGNMVFFSSI